MAQVAAWITQLLHYGPKLCTGFRGNLELATYPVKYTMKSDGCLSGKPFCIVYFIHFCIQMCFILTSVLKILKKCRNVHAFVFEKSEKN